MGNKLPKNFASQADNVEAWEMKRFDTPTTAQDEWEEYQTFKKNH